MGLELNIPKGTGIVLIDDDNVTRAIVVSKDSDEATISAIEFALTAEYKGMECVVTNIEYYNYNEIRTIIAQLWMNSDSEPIILDLLAAESIIY